MTAPDVNYNGTALSSFDFIVGGCSLQYSYPVRTAKSSHPDAGVTAEATMGSLSIKMSGDIANKANLGEAFSRFGSIMKLFRGTGVGISRGQLDLFDDGKHWLVQVVGSPSFVPRPGLGQANVSFEFVADDPFRRLEFINKSATTTLPITLSYGPAADFNGDAPVMPCIFNCNSGWTAGQRIRVLNSTTGYRFEYVVSAAIQAGEAVVINGETHVVKEGERTTMKIVSGTFPFVVGGQSNTFDFTGTSASKITTIEFWDRYWT